MRTESLEHRAPASRSGVDSVRAVSARGAVCGAAFALLAAALWSLTHRYRGLVGDSELYAVQALARIDASLARDVFLGGASQDRYTVFSPVYSFFIRILGLKAAALSLLVIFKTCFYGAAWATARKLVDSRTALVTTAFLIVAPAEYGAYHVFRVSEDMLTARTLAEMLAMTALCLYVHGRRAAALTVAAFALSIHALMALPMVLLLLSLRAGIRASAAGALGIVAAVLAAASMAVLAPRWTPSLLSVMDPGWLEMVRERSQFVFLQLWRLDDWCMNARPFISLALSILVLRDPRVRSICAAALIVGGTGLAVAFIAGGIGPVAILLQGQAWRWVWIPQIIGLLVLASTLFRMWDEDRCGSLCAVLLLMGWFLSVIDGVYCVAASLVLWACRKRVPAGAAPCLRFLAALVGVMVLGWIAFKGWKTLSPPRAPQGAESEALLIARSVLGLDCVALILAFLLGGWILRARSMAVPCSLALALGAVTAYAAPDALEDPRAEGSAAQIEEFSDWRGAIPPGDNVLVVSKYYSPSFTWFTLQRPSYLTVDQSSGVIFSRSTAVEIRRRAEVLLPIEQPDWRLLSRRASRGGATDAHAAPLTRERLVRICADPQLNFVVAREDVGFLPLRHRRPGFWNGWNLYDCRQVGE